MNTLGDMLIIANNTCHLFIHLSPSHVCLPFIFEFYFGHSPNQPPWAGESLLYQSGNVMKVLSCDGALMWRGQFALVKLDQSRGCEEDREEVKQRLGIGEVAVRLWTGRWRVGGAARIWYFYWILTPYPDRLGEPGNLMVEVVQIWVTPLWSQCFSLY